MASSIQPFPHMNDQDLDGGRAWRDASTAGDLGMTRLHEAVMAGDVDEVVGQLADGGREAYVNRGMRYGFTALHLAAKAYSNAAQGFRTATTLDRWRLIIQMLLDDGADAAARDWQNRIPLALADGFAPKVLRDATELAAKRGQFHSPEDGIGPQPRLPRCPTTIPTAW